MNLPFSVFLTLIFCIALSSCSIDIDQSPANNPQQVTGLAWSNLHLTGKLVYNIGMVQDEQISTSIQSLDLISGEVTTIWQPPGAGWINSAAVSPDTELLIISYDPPGSTGSPAALYSMPLNASQPPQLVFAPASDNDQYFQPAWSPDGRYLYFAHLNYEISLNYDIMRMAYPAGKPEKLIANAYWPRLSDDGSRLVYVALDAESGANSLVIANADGTDAQQVPVTDLPVPTIFDAPMFSPDDQTILFSSPLGIQESAPNPLDRIMGVIVASADGSLPSDWWSVPVSGGKASQLTHTRSLGLFGSYAPDKKYFASYSSGGIFVMKPEGSEITVIVPDVGQISGTVDWIR